MKPSIRQQLAKRKRRLESRLMGRGRRNLAKRAFGAPQFDSRHVRYEVAERSQGMVYGGVALLHQVAQRLGLPEAINRLVPLFKLPIGPYRESDHVLNIAFNALCEGRCLQDIQLRREDEAFCDALGTNTIPAPSTAGDFCRRFTPSKILDLEGAIHVARRVVWKQQPEAFFAVATLDADGTQVVTGAECKEGIGMNYKKEWGYHPLVISLAETKEPLSIINRPGNRPSHEGAAEALDRQIALCRGAGFRKIVLRGDTDFKQTAHLDRWQDTGVTFFFGYDAYPNLIERAEGLENSVWKRLERSPPPACVKTRRRRGNVKKVIVQQHGYLNLTLEHEDLAEFDYRPGACCRSYRMVVLRKTITVTKGQILLIPQTRYFFFITNDRERTPPQVVEQCHQRCNQENLHAQLAAGLRALSAPVDNLVSNGAYMLMASLAWTLKAWSALLLPVTPRWQEKHEGERKRLLTMEFRTFVNHFVKLPCLVVHQARRVFLRVLTWNPDLSLFFRIQDAVLRL